MIFALLQGPGTPPPGLELDQYPHFGVVLERRRAREWSRDAGCRGVFAGFVKTGTAPATTFAL